MFLYNSYTCTLPHFHTITLSRTHSLSHTYSHNHSLPYTNPYFSLSHAHTPYSMLLFSPKLSSLSLLQSTHTPTTSDTHTPTHTHTLQFFPHLTPSHTHTHTHTLSLTFSFTHTPHLTVLSLPSLSPLQSSLHHSSQNVQDRLATYHGGASMVDVVTYQLFFFLYIM